MDQLMMIRPKVSIKAESQIRGTDSSADTQEAQSFTGLLKDRSAEIESAEAKKDQPVSKDSEEEKDEIENEAKKGNPLLMVSADQAGGFLWKSLSWNVQTEDPALGDRGEGNLLIKAWGQENIRTADIPETGRDILEKFPEDGQAGVYLTEEREPQKAGMGNLEAETVKGAERQGIPLQYAVNEETGQKLERKDGSGETNAGNFFGSAGKETEGPKVWVEEKAWNGYSDSKKDENSRLMETSQNADMTAAMVRPLEENRSGPVFQQVFSTEKAGQESSQGNVLSTSFDSLPEDLGSRLQAQLTGKDQVLELELEPASLGKLTIRAVYEGGKANISILATDPKTLEILNQHAGELRSILEDRIGQTTVVYADSFYQETEQNSSFQEREGRGQERQQRQDRRHTDSFAQQLRLGLI